MTYLDYLEQKVLLERLVIGLEEPVLIKGLGELSAKIDSGNGGYNVIHGTDFHQQGSELMFTTHDSFGHEKKMQATVIDTIEVNMGGGNIESRPVIELDIKFAGEDYKKIPFSVSDRSSNSNPILISKGFVENELEALIDVGAMNISHEGRDVVYGEGVGSFLKGTANFIQNTNDKVVNAMNKTTQFLKGGDNVNLLSPITASLAGIAKLISSSDELIENDITSIRQKLPHSVLANKLKKDGINVKNTIWENYNEIDFAKTAILPFVTFAGKLGNISNGYPIKGLEKKIESWKSSIKSAKKQIISAKEQNNSKEEQEEVLAEANMGEDMMSAAAQGSFTTNATPSSTSVQTPEPQQSTETSNIDSESTDKNKTDKQSPSTSDTKSGSKEELDNIEETTTEFKQLNNFILYYIPSYKIDNDTNFSNIKIKPIFDNLLSSGRLDDIALKFFNIGEINADSIISILRVFVKYLNNINYNTKGFEKKYSGSFALVTGEANNRQVHLYDDPNEAVVISNYNSDIDDDTIASNDSLNTSAEQLNILFPNLKKQIEYFNDDQNSLNNLFNEIQSKSDNIKTLYKFLNPNDKETVKSLAVDGISYNQDSVKSLIQLAKGPIQTATIKSTLNQYDIGKEFLSLISGKVFKDWGDFVRFCSENEEIQNLLSQEAKDENIEDQEEDIWIREKLNHFKNKGII